MQLFIDNRQEKIDIDKDIEELIEKVVRECLLIEEKDIESEVSVSFVDNKEIKELNKDYRGIDKETDVLSFPMEEEFPMPIPLLGDIIISTDKVIEQANEFNHSIEREIAYLTAHSMFHLMGYDHIDKEDKKIMRSREDMAMDNLSIDRNYKGE